MERNKTILDRKKVIDLINENGGDRAVFNKLRSALEKIGPLGRLPRSDYSDSTQNRLLYGSVKKNSREKDFSPFYLVESIFLSKILDVSLSEIIDEDNDGIISGTGLDTFARTISFSSDDGKEEISPEERLAKYFMKKEKGERIVICQDFPSSIYVNNEFQKERYNQLSNSIATNTEYYPIKSILSFAFSPISSFGRDEKISIFDQMLNMINLGHSNIYFFDHIQDGFPGNFASMNIVNRENLVIILISVPNVVLEIRNRDLLEMIMRYFRNRENKKMLSFSSSEKLTKILRDMSVENTKGVPLSRDDLFNRCADVGIVGLEATMIFDQFS